MAEGGTGIGILATFFERDKFFLVNSAIVQNVLIIFSSFVAGIFLVGGAHELVWIMTSNEPIFTWDAYSVSRRVQSRNNLRNLGLAFHSFHDGNSGLPESMAFNERGQIRHSWMTALLPYIDQGELQKEIRLDLAWSAPENQRAFQTRIQPFTNPRIGQPDHSSEYALSHYAGNQLVLRPGRRRPIQEITDGTSNTILAGEVNSEFEPWGKPGNCRDPRLGINQSQYGFGSPFQGGGHVLLADGSVRFISESIAPKVLNALATPDGGEKIDDF